MSISLNAAAPFDTMDTQNTQRLVLPLPAHVRGTSSPLDLSDLEHDRESEENRRRCILLSVKRHIKLTIVLLSSRRMTGVVLSVRVCFIMFTV